MKRTCSLLTRAAILLSVTLLSGAAARAENTETNETDASSLNYISARGNLYSKSFRRIGDDGWGAKLTVRGKIGIHKFETINDLLKLDKENIATAGIEPKLTLAFPVEFLDNVLISPRASFELLEDYTSGDTTGMLSAQAGLALVYNQPGFYEELSVSLAANYGTRYAYDGLNPSDFASVSLEASSKHYLGFKVGKYKVMMHPYGKYGYFFESLVVEAPSGGDLHIRNETEIGAKIQSDPRKLFWKIKVPRIKIGYTFGDGVQGVKISLST